MRIDAHQHYWKISRNDYGWITPEISVLYRDFLEDDLKNHLKRNQIDKTIVIQAAPTEEETEFLLSLSEHADTIAGVVGWVDIGKGDYKEQLEKWMKHPKFVGIRVMIQDMPDETVILSPEFLEAFRYFAKIDLPVDLLVRSDQLSALLKLLKEVTFRGVIDHIAKPDIASGTRDPWELQMTEIARYPSIYCKVSGMVTEAEAYTWKKDDFIFYVHHIFREFGTDRVMFGSDWPVCLLAATYDQVYELLNNTLPNYVTEEDKQNIFGGNAMKFYQLKN